MVLNPRSRYRENKVGMFSLISEAEKKGIISPAFAFCSIQAINGSNDAQAHWKRQFTVLSPPIQMLISSENIPKDNIQKQCFI